MGISDLNRKGNVNFDINTDGFPYVKVSELVEGQTYVLKGCFITGDHGYGKGAVLITDGKMVNIPNRYVDVIQEIIDNKQFVDDINAGKCAFKYETFVSKKFNRKSYEIIFMEV